MKKLISILKVAGVALLSVTTALLSSCSIGSESIHGQELLKLTDDELFETVYFQNIDLVMSYPDESQALSQISPEQRTFYILSIYDMEIQNGGLCQFFVNSSRSLAPFVDECLETVGAEEHRKLLAEFVADNNIDLNNLESFDTPDIEDYILQTQRYDFDSFDNAYYELTALRDYLVEYVKNNITAF